MDALSAENVRFIVSVTAPIVSGLGGVPLGWFTTKRSAKKERQLKFIEKQLNEFYSPMLGLRAEIKKLSELREHIATTANTVWQELCERERLQDTVEGKTAFTTKRWPEFERLIRYDNTQIEERLLPARGGAGI